MPCAQVLPQRWNVQAEGGAQIITDAANYCLDLLGGNTQNGSPVEVWECNGSPQQHWGYDADPAQKTIYLSDSSRRLRGQALVPKPAVSAVPVAVGASLCMGAPKPGQTPVEVMPCAQVLPQRWNVQAEGGAQIIADAANY